MLYDQLLAPTPRGTQHHICREVPEMDAALADLKQRPGICSYTRPLGIRTEVNRRRHLNLFDPDGTRTELMEPTTVDGQRGISSPDPPPH